MGYRVPKQPLEYHLVGACTFLSKETIKQLGYGNHKNLVDTRVPVLVYGKEKEIDDCSTYFTEIPPGSGKMKYIHPDIIKELYNLELAQEIFPELFI